MTRNEIIELANQLTERKGEKVLNLQSLYRFVVQDISKRTRFWWRRVQVTFPFTPEIGLYDLTNAALFPSLTEIALDEITKFSFILSPNPLQVVELTPIFDPEAVQEMVWNNNPASGFTTIQPARYSMNPGDYKTLIIDPPNLAYTAFLTGWGMPNPASDSTSDAVPLIPPWGHNTIVEGLKAKIFGYVYGEEHAKTVNSEKKYEMAILDLQSRPKFDPNYRSQLSLAEDAVRST